MEAWQGIATCLHSIVGWWADQVDEEAEMQDDDDEEPDDEYSLPIYSRERGQMSLQGKKLRKPPTIARTVVARLSSDPAKACLSFS